MSEGKNLKQLGAKQTVYKYDEPSCEILETFKNKCPQRDYNIEFVSNEFTSLCPKTGQPDFASIKINYIADEDCIESKSLKLYLFAYRSYGAFMETIVNKILDDLVSVCSPRFMVVEGQFNVRGGIEINVRAEHKKISSVDS
jgi:7-cyano-7-deazaguanine reductase